MDADMDEGNSLARSVGAVPSPEKLLEEARAGRPATIEGAEFRASVDLSGLRVDGDLRLRRCVFHERVLLRDLQVDGVLDLSDSVFRKGFDLRRVSVRRSVNLTRCRVLRTDPPVDFKRVEWWMLTASDGRSTLDSATVGESLLLTGARFGATCSIASARIGGDVLAERALFLQGLDLGGARIEGGLDLGSTPKGPARIRGHLNLSLARITGNVSMSAVTVSHNFALQGLQTANLYLDSISPKPGSGGRLRMPRIGGSIDATLAHCGYLGLSDTVVEGDLMLTNIQVERLDCQCREAADPPPRIGGGLYLSGTVDEVNVGGLTIGASPHRAEAPAVSLTSLHVSGNLSLCARQTEPPEHASREPVLVPTSVHGDIHLQFLQIANAFDLRGLSCSGNVALTNVSAGVIVARTEPPREGHPSIPPTRIEGSLYGEIDCRGQVDLAGIHVGSLLDLSSARMSGDLDLRGARVDGHFWCVRARIGHNLLAGRNFDLGTYTVFGEDVILRQASIGGAVELFDCTVNGALLAEQAEVAGSFYMTQDARDAGHATGLANDAPRARDLPRCADAVVLRGLKLGGDLILDGLQVAGDLQLDMAEIGGDVSLDPVSLPGMEPIVDMLRYGVSADLLRALDAEPSVLEVLESSPRVLSMFLSDSGFPDDARLAGKEHEAWTLERAAAYVQQVQTGKNTEPDWTPPRDMMPLASSLAVVAERCVEQTGRSPRVSPRSSADLEPWRRILRRVRVDGSVTATRATVGGELRFQYGAVPAEHGSFWARGCQVRLDLRMTETRIGHEMSLQGSTIGGVCFAVDSGVATGLPEARRYDLTTLEATELIIDTRRLGGATPARFEPMDRAPGPRIRLDRAVLDKLVIAQPGEDPRPGERAARFLSRAFSWYPSDPLFSTHGISFRHLLVSSGESPRGTAPLDRSTLMRFLHDSQFARSLYLTVEDWLHKQGENMLASEVHRCMRWRTVQRRLLLPAAFWRVALPLGALLLPLARVWIIGVILMAVSVLPLLERFRRWLRARWEQMRISIGLAESVRQRGGPAGALALLADREPLSALPPTSPLDRLRAWGEAVFGAFLGFGRSALHNFLALLVLILLGTFAFLTPDSVARPLSFHPADQMVTAPPQGQPEEWGASDALWMSLRSAIPMVDVPATNDWEPANRRARQPFGPLTYAEIGSLITVLGWIYVPVLIWSLAVLIKPRQPS